LPLTPEGGRNGFSRSLQGRKYDPPYSGSNSSGETGGCAVINKTRPSKGEKALVKKKAPPP